VAYVELKGMISVSVMVNMFHLTNLIFKFAFMALRLYLIHWFLFPSFII